MVEPYWGWVQKGGTGNLYTYFELEQNRVKTHGGDVVRVQVPAVGHVVVGGDLYVGVVCGHEEQFRHEGVCRQQHVGPWGPGPEQHPLCGFGKFLVLFWAGVKRSHSPPTPTNKTNSPSTPPAGNGKSILALSLLPPPQPGQMYFHTFTPSPLAPLSPLPFTI